MLTHAEIMPILERWSSKLRITPAWDVKLELVADPAPTKRP